MPDSADLSSYLAGQIGQAGLDRLAGAADPGLDQHVAAVRAAIAAVLPRPGAGSAQVLSALVRYASGIVDAATGRGWWPASTADQPLDWESLRLAAVCHLVTEASQGPDQPKPGSSRQQAS
jgi:hypothetical protein